MSYDLMVFEPEAAPKSHTEFVTWYGVQTAWSEARTYDDPAATSLRLQAWLIDMFSIYPPMNGPNAAEELPADESALTDYSIGQHIVYACFAWSRASTAYDDVFRLAAKHHLGFFNVSSDEAELWLPQGGQLTLARQGAGMSIVGHLRRLVRRFFRRLP